MRMNLLSVFPGSFLNGVEVGGIRSVFHDVSGLAVQNCTEGVDCLGAEVIIMMDSVKLGSRDLVILHQ